MIRLPHRTTFRASAGLAILTAAVFSSAQITVHASPGTFNGTVNTVSLGPGNTVSGGININSFLKATTLYGLGYTGTRSTLANIEGGYSQTDGLATYAKNVVTFNGTGALTYAFSTSAMSSVQPHATMVSAMMAGYAPDYAGDPTYEPVFTGLAYGAKLWTGNIAITANANTGGFTTSTNATWSAYNQAMRIGVGTNGTADIINSSWGPTSNTTDSSTGRTVDAIGVDYLVQQTHKLAFFSAGNSAYNFNTGQPVTGLQATPAGIPAGWNTITVGSLGSNNPGNPAASYSQRSVFSSYGPSNYYDPNTGNTIQGVRATVDISAPGEAIVAETKRTNAQYQISAGDGTSFASPITAGIAGLLVDAAKAKGYTNAPDSRVMAAILMTGADKTSGWTNNATTVSNVYGTTQGLDWGTGAGRVNAEKSYSILTGGTTDLPGLGGGAVQSKGWDLGSVAELTPTDYSFSGLLAGSSFTSTLRWDAGFGVTSTDTTLTGASYSYLSNLRLELWQANDLGAATSLVAFSDSLYNNTEHIFFTIPTTSTYVLRVKWIGENYDFVNHANSETYGLAWNGTYGMPAAVPEPASLAALGLGAVALLRRRRKA